MTQYLEDVEDHLETYLEEISRSIGVRNPDKLQLHAAPTGVARTPWCFPYQVKACSDLRRLPPLWRVPRRTVASEVCDSLRDQVRSLRDRDQQGVPDHRAAVRAAVRAAAVVEGWSLAMDGRVEWF